MRGWPLLLVACGGELGPEDVGYEDCDVEDLGPDCEEVELCCKRTDETDVRCKYTHNGVAYTCEEDSMCDDDFNCETTTSCDGAREEVSAVACLSR